MGWFHLYSLVVFGVLAHILRHVGRGGTYCMLMDCTSQHVQNRNTPVSRIILRSFTRDYMLLNHIQIFYKRFHIQLNDVTDVAVIRLIEQCVLEQYCHLI